MWMGNRMVSLFPYSANSVNQAVCEIVCRECGVNRFIATGLHLQLLCEMETLSNDLFHGPRTVAPWT